MTEVIDGIQEYSEQILFSIVEAMRNAYAPWMALALAGVAGVFALLTIYFILMWAFNHKQRWYHKVIYWFPVVKSCGNWMFRKGHGVGAVWGYEQGYKSNSGRGVKKLKHGKIVRALKNAGM